MQMGEVAHKKGAWPQLEVADLALACLAGDPTPRLFLAPPRTVLWANVAARQVLGKTGGVELREGQLLVEDSAGQDALVDLVTSALKGAATICLPATDGDGFWLLSAEGLGNASNPAVVSLVVRRTGSTFEARYGSFREPFGLTAAEYQAASLLIAGRTAEEIASQTGTKISTVRAHIRALYAKMDVSSREMLFYRLRPFRIV
jgi:DNA-binding CsgD family transcriptional regulator